MKIVKDNVSIGELKELAAGRFGNLVKAVVDIDKGIMAVDAELHADEESALLEDGSKQSSLWGINLYPDLAGADFIEFDSLINLRPSQGNRTRGIDNPGIQEKIRAIVTALVVK